MSRAPGWVPGAPDYRDAWLRERLDVPRELELLGFAPARLVLARPVLELPPLADSDFFCAAARPPLWPARRPAEADCLLAGELLRFEPEDRDDFDFAAFAPREDELELREFEPELRVEALRPEPDRLDACDPFPLLLDWLAVSAETSLLK